MYIIDGIAYSGEPARPVKVVSACPLDGWRLKLRFSTGEMKIFDFAPLLDFPCFRTLQDESVFRSVSLDHGVPVWLDGEIDIAPEKLWQDGKPENCFCYEQQAVSELRSLSSPRCPPSPTAQG